MPCAADERNSRSRRDLSVSAAPACFPSASGAVFYYGLPCSLHMGGNASGRLFQQRTFSDSDQRVVCLKQRASVQHRMDDPGVPPIPGAQRRIAAAAQQLLRILQLRLQGDAEAENSVPGRNPFPGADLIEIDFADAGGPGDVGPRPGVMLQQGFELFGEHGRLEIVRVMLEKAVKLLVSSEIPAQLRGALF